MAISGSSGMSAGDTGSSEDDSAADSSFITDPDGGYGGCLERLPEGTLALSIECSVQDQDCCRGEACKAWANDGGDAWNASRCTFVSDTPAQVGEPCVAEGSPVSGADTCDAGLMCWDVDAKSLQGTCAQFCGEDGPSCEAEGEVCSIGNDGAVPLCLPSCDPLASECGEGIGCYPSGEDFVCVREGTPMYTDLQHPDCAAGTFNIPADQVQGCSEGEGPCCTAFCDLSAVEPCGADAECLPYFVPAMGKDDTVGYCSVAS